MTLPEMPGFAPLMIAMAIVAIPLPVFVIVFVEGLIRWFRWHEHVMLLVGLIGTLLLASVTTICFVFVSRTDGIFGASTFDQLGPIYWTVLPSTLVLWGTVLVIRLFVMKPAMNRRLVRQ